MKQVTHKQSISPRFAVKDSSILLFFSDQIFHATVWMAAFQILWDPSWGTIDSTAWWSWQTFRYRPINSCQKQASNSIFGWDPNMNEKVRNRSSAWRRIGHTCRERVMCEVFHCTLPRAFNLSQVASNTKARLLESDKVSHVNLHGNSQLQCIFWWEDYKERSSRETLSSEANHNMLSSFWRVMVTDARLLITVAIPLTQYP